MGEEREREREVRASSAKEPARLKRDSSWYLTVVLIILGGNDIVYACAHIFNPSCCEQFNLFLHLFYV